MSMETIITIVACISVGFFLRITGILSKDDASVLNRLIIYFFLPIISILHIPSIELNSGLMWLTISPFIVFVGSYVFFKMIKGTSALSQESFKSLVLTCGIGSTSFVGFPIFELLYGDEGLAYGVFLSLGGTILVFNTVGMYFLVKYSSAQHLSVREILKKLVTFFPFLVFLVAIIFNVFGISYSDRTTSLLQLLASPFSVIALVAIGIQINVRSIKTYKFELFVGQLYKLIVSPLIIFLLIWVIFGKEDTLARVCILGAGIGSMNAISVLAAEKKVQPELSLMMPAIGIPLSVFSLFAIDYLL